MMGDRTIVNRTVVKIVYDKPILHLEHVKTSLLAPGELADLIRTEGVILWNYDGRWGILTKGQMWKLLGEWLSQQSTVEPLPRLIENYEGISFENAIPTSHRIARALMLVELDTRYMFSTH